MEAYAITNRGWIRRENQDRYFIREWEGQGLLVAVADGMGGEAGGGLAAQIAIDTVGGFTLPDPPAIEESLRKLFQSASQKIIEEVRKDFRLEGMGTTLTAAFIKNGMTTWAHVGDSRLYLFRGGNLTQITEDDTLLNEYIKEGKITPDEARGHPLQNILLACVGCSPFSITSGTFKISEEDLIVLSTDGLHHEVAEEKIVSALSGKGSVKKILEILIRAALEAGGRDNITLAAVRI